MRVPLTPTEIVMLSKDKPLDFEPGVKFAYDNTGYVFLGAIIEKVPARNMPSISRSTFSARLT